MFNALTIDVEEWFDICGLKQKIRPEDYEYDGDKLVRNVAELLSLLEQNKVRATFFILGETARKYPQAVKMIDDRGHEIATHGFSHRLIYDLSPDEFREDLKKSISILKEITAKEVIGHRAPSFSITKDSLWAFKILREEGIRYDCSVFPISHPRYGIEQAKRFPYLTDEGVMEFPLSTVDILGKNFPVAGGAYLRILPYHVTRWGIKKINSRWQPAQIYLHSWEIDCNQPRLKIPWMRRFTHSVNLKTTLNKLKSLLGDFEFAPVKEVLKIGGYPETEKLFPGYRG